ncbi:iron uptake transporter permease EfeU [Acidocella sp.]|uniref:iron uptake transporter permease EfeU n=1 Tax=Acidocella sp. TaxID=50710 RepID=UPI002623C15B|nr:iron uptake transporter permease EfeU [Acidocella sp.]
MLATFIIGLREGLEAALIVGIIAAFLKKNGRPLAAMWMGVGLALLLSLLVGVGLDVLERALPQAEQEAMETIIGGIAVFFVTGMIVWMNQHARTMKRELEAQAAAALGHTGVLALALMAFLAVMKEGFETAVFLLATFSAAQSAALAAWGAVLGILLAVAIGWGIYIGGVKINLSRFFRVTGFFLILVAAGLVVSALRTAHEAGWLNIGQDRTLDLAWLVTPGTVRSALITGVLGIPADPRLAELCGWLAYFIPVTLYLYWPRRYRPAPAATRRLRLALAALCLAAAAGLALFPAPRPMLAPEAPVVAGDGSLLGTARLAGGALRLDLQGRQSVIPLPAAAASVETRGGLAVKTWHLQGGGAVAQAPSVLTAEQLVALNGGQVPIGLNPRQHPGPYHAAWSETLRTDVWAADGVLIEARHSAARAVTISGSGFYSPRTLTLPPDGTGAWRVAAEWSRAAPAALARLKEARQAHLFWGRAMPGALVIAALLLAWPARRAGQTVSREQSHLSPLYEGQRNVTD